MVVLTQYKNGGDAYLHHCRLHKAVVSNRCLKNGCAAHCSVCKRLFQVQSPSGCNEHPYHEGYNKEAVNYFKGRDASFRSSFDQEQAQLAAERAEREVMARTRAEQQAQQGRLRNDWNKNWNKENDQKNEWEKKDKKEQRRMTLDLRRGALVGKKRKDSLAPGRKNNGA